MKKLTLAAIIAGFTLAAQAAPFKVGSMSGQEADLVKAAAQVAKEKHGLDVEIVEFDDYVAPNVALADGSIDANAFQHKPYLDVMVKDRGLKLVPVGNTFVYPIGAYSKKIKDIKELKDGATIGLPGDPSNEGRSLILLEKQGLIKLKDSKNLESTVMDIAENPHNYKFSEVDASLVPNSLPDVDLAFINSNYAINADLLPKRDSGRTRFAVCEHHRRARSGQGQGRSEKIRRCLPQQRSRRRGGKSLQGRRRQGLVNPPFLPPKNRPPGRFFRSHHAPHRLKYGAWRYHPWQKQKPFRNNAAPSLKALRPFLISRRT